MIVDLQRNETLPEFHAEICIVGAGAAGLILAAELVRQGRTVLLLESGGSGAEPAPQSLNHCSYTGQPRRNAASGRYRALGGTTTLWGGQILDLDEEDFLERSWAPGSGWPFVKAELDPYYQRAIEMEGLGDACRTDREIWQRIRVPAPNMGDAFEPYFTRWCPEPNFARLFRNTIESPLLCVALHATATTFLLSENGSRVGGVECITPQGKKYIFSADHYALCLGTIESSRFLLQPLHSEQTPPWNCNGLVGRHFQSHIDLDIAQIPSPAAANLRPWFANVYRNGYKYHPKIRLSPAVQRTRQVLNIAGAVTCRLDKREEAELRRVKSAARHAVHGRFGQIRGSDLSLALRYLPTVAGLGCGYLKHRAYWPKNSSFHLRVHCEQAPLSESHIGLTNTRDATGMYEANLDWQVSPLEWETIRCFTEQARDGFQKLGVAGLETIPELAREDGFRGMTFDASHHDMGGTRMAINAAHGVVDPNLKLHGLANAYVCSASVFPCSGFSNPTHTLIALAIRLAEHLGHKYTSVASNHATQKPIVESSSNA